MMPDVSLTKVVLIAVFLLATPFLSSCGRSSPPSKRGRIVTEHDFTARLGFQKFGLQVYERTYLDPSDSTIAQDHYSVFFIGRVRCSVQVGIAGIAIWIVVASIGVVLCLIVGYAWFRRGFALPL